MCEQGLKERLQLWLWDLTTRQGLYVVPVLTGIGVLWLLSDYYSAVCSSHHMYNTAKQQVCAVVCAAIGSDAVCECLQQR
jgi:hypothetical protein